MYHMPESRVLIDLLEKFKNIDLLGSIRQLGLIRVRLVVGLYRHKIGIANFCLDISRLVYGRARTGIARCLGYSLKNGICSSTKMSWTWLSQAKREVEEDEAGEARRLGAANGAG